MMHGDDLEQLVGNDAQNAPEVPVKPHTSVIPSEPPQKKISKAKQGLLSIASHTIIPMDHQPPPAGVPKSIDLPRPRSVQPKPIAPPPPPPTPMVSSTPSSTNPQESNEPEFGFGAFETDIGRKEPTLGLPSMDSLPSSSTLGAPLEEETEEIVKEEFYETDFDFPDEDTELWTEEDELALEQFNNERRRNNGVLWAFGGLVLIGIVLIPIGLIGLPYLSPGTPDPKTITKDAPEQTIVTDANEKAVPATEDANVLPEPPTAGEAKPDAPAPEVDTTPVLSPTKDEVVERQPEPPPEKPKVKVEPKIEAPVQSVPKTKSRREFIEAGWNLVESNPGRAAKSFRQALELNRGDFEANYGYGYAMLKQGDPAEAQHYLCIASGSGDKETQREVLAVLGRNGMNCN